MAIFNKQRSLCFLLTLKRDVMSSASETEIAVYSHEWQAFSSHKHAVLLEKLTGLQLVKKFPTFYGTRRLIITFTSAHHLTGTKYTMRAQNRSRSHDIKGNECFRVLFLQSERRLRGVGRAGVRLPKNSKNFLLLQHVETGPETQTSSYSVGTVGSFTRVKRLRRKTDHLSPPYAHVKNE
jgi:hypothetical protein